MTRGGKKPLYRKVNSRARGAFHGTGRAARHDRNTKAAGQSGAMHGSMHSGQRHGLDYTPLFRFLLSRVGQDWAKTHAEALSRLDSEEPIFHLVARGEDDRYPFVRYGEASYYSGLFVDDAGLLQKVDPTLGVEDFRPWCSCCTHTFNGDRFIHPFDPERRGLDDR